MTSYERGDVILVDIAFSGAVGYKRRPAVVISTTVFNGAGIKLIVAAITSNVSPPFRPATCCSTIGAVKGCSSLRQLGMMAAADFANVEQNVAGILGFLASSSTPTS